MKRINVKDINLGATFNGFKHAFVKKVLSPQIKYQKLLEKLQSLILKATTEIYTPVISIKDLQE